MRTLRFGLLCSAALLSAGMADTGWAQSATRAEEAPTASDADIVVTAQRRSERLQDVPLSIAAFSSEQLATSGVKSLEQLADRTPGVFFKSLNPAMPNAAIRGIGTTQSDNSAEAPIGLFVDDVYVASFAAGPSSFFDVDRIEILRGPQGTLYGRNTIGGAINIITRDPTRDLQGSLEGEIGTYGAIRTRVALSGPLSDTLSARVAFATNNRDGWTRNATLNNRRTNDENNVGARLKLLYEPSDRLRLKVTADYSRDNQTDALAEIKGTFAFPIAPPRAEATPDPYVSQSDLYGYDKRKLWSVSLKGEYALSDSVGLTTITAYRHHRSNILRDLDSTALPVIAANDTEKGDQFSQEVRLASAGDTPFKWLLGAYYFTADSSRREFWTIGGTLPQFAAVQGNYGWPFKGGTDSYAAFGQASYALTEQFEVVAGLRYSHDKKDGTFRVFSTAPSPLGAFVSPPAGFTAAVSKSWSSVDPAVTLNFRPNQDVLFYASFKTGFKSGGFQNRPSTLIAATTAYDPEDVKVYEGGIKSQWFDRKLTANLSLYHYDYRDLQQTVLKPNTAITVTDNVGKARIRGGELELAFRPTSQLSLNLGYAYNDAIYKDYIDGSNVQRAGNRLSRAPKHMWNLAGEYTLPTGLGDLAFRLEYIHQSRIFYTPDNAGVNQEAPYGLLNARIALSTSDRLTVSVRGSNLTKTDYCANQATSIPSLTAARCWVGAPREFALNVAYRF